MLEISIWLGIFIVSLFLLIKASDIFTDSAEKIGLFLGFPPFVVGVAIVAIGTSLPELMSSISAVFQGSSEIVFGNVIGSNVANIFLIVGIASILANRIQLKYEIASVDLPLFVGSAFLLTLMLLTEGFSIGEALLCILAYFVYLMYTMNHADLDFGLGKEEGSNSQIETSIEGFPVRSIIFLVLSTVAIYLSAKYTVRSIVMLSEILDIGKDVIAVSVLAFGTSLPELMVSIVCVRKGKGEMAVGNVLGSNIFNSLVVMGVPRLFGNLVIPTTTLNEGLLEMMFGTILMFFVVQDKQITRWEGYLFLIFYTWFIAQIFYLV
ncbi:MAG: calcium/sodium antiporter [Cyanobacteria bacterium SID2]|nr:calcium/sodium antiporter [Cyanobacteria bacterium SID2]MBP0005885.1 calcium/sodium antiporter [Cyanobacteria bacterium SBC]